MPQAPGRTAGLSMESYDFEYRVRYGDTDKMGISYYANYFVWFEAARTEYFRELGLPYTECEKKGYYLPAVETGAKYFSPSTYDDLVVVRTSVARLGPTSMRFEYRVLNAARDKVHAEGFSVHVFVDRNMKPVRMPEKIRSAVTVFSLLDKKR